MAVISGEERLKEMEAEMALFEQEVLGAPVSKPAVTAVVEAVPMALAVPTVPVIRPIIATNTYQQVQQSLEARAAAIVASPPAAFVGPAVPPRPPPVLRPAFVPHILQRTGAYRMPMIQGPPPPPMVAPPMPRPPPPPPIMVGPPIPGSPPHHMGHMNPLTPADRTDAPNGSCSQASGAASTKAHTNGNPGGSHRVYSPTAQEENGASHPNTQNTTGSAGVLSCRTGNCSHNNKCHANGRK